MFIKLRIWWKLTTFAMQIGFQKSKPNQIT